MQILLTNDDGIDSPALVPFARALAGLGDVRVVVPDGERSWTGKALTRFEPVVLRAVRRDGVVVHAASGTPADAAHIGVHRDGPPDVVVSGINLGHNHGTAFLLSSGTVGAAAEATLTGHTAVAFSTGLMDADFRQWRHDIQAPTAATRWEALAHLCTDLLADVLASGLPDHCDLVSVNVPWTANEDTSRHVTSLARTRYGALFSRDGVGPATTAAGSGDALGERGVERAEDADGVPLDRAGRGDVSSVDAETWIQTFTSLDVVGELEGSDIATALAHQVSITPVLLPSSARVPDEVRDRLTRPVTP